MAQKLFRILNLCWAALVTCTFALLWMFEPTVSTEPVLIFWSVYLLAAIGTFLDLRAAWMISILLLSTVWLLMGVVVSDGSFAVFTGEQLHMSNITHVRHMGSINMVVFNTFFGLTAPSSALLILAFFSREHVVWLFSERRRRRAMRRRQARRGAGFA